MTLRPSQVALVIKDLPASAGVVRDVEPIPGMISLRREWHLTPVFLPGKFHGQRSLAGYSPCGLNELDMTERPSTHTHTRLDVLSMTGRHIFSCFSYVSLNKYMRKEILKHELYS